MHPWDKYSWNFWDPQIDPLPETPKIYRKVSICTSIMNRLSDFKTTFPKNLENNKDYPNVEFVILDYNSSDGLGEWIRTTYMDQIESGRVVYVRTEEPEFYTMSHSRNVAFKASSGDIVNNLDADNYTGNGFASIINKMAEVCPRRAAFVKGKRMMHGRIGFYRNEWEAAGGYDEDLYSYGFDDHNLLYRMMILGCKLMWWGYFGPSYSERINTSRQDKVLNMEHKNRKWTENENKTITYDKIDKGILIANRGRHWGKATLVRNFDEEINL